MEDEFDTTLKLPPGIAQSRIEPYKIDAIIQYSNLQYVDRVAKVLVESEFAMIKNSYFSPIVNLSRWEDIQFSRKLFHFLMQRRILTQGEDLWFAFAEQPMRFSLQEFFITTRLRCEPEVIDTHRKATHKRVKKPYHWMLGKKDSYNVKHLLKLLETKGKIMAAEERLSLGATILTEGIIISENPMHKVPQVRSNNFLNFDTYSSHLWGRIGYEFLSTSIRRMNEDTWAKGQYEVK